MNTTTRVLLAASIVVALAACTKKTKPEETTQVDTTPATTAPVSDGRYTPADLDTDACLRQRMLEQRDRAPDMVARRQFRHHAAVLLVHRHLRVQGVGQQAALRVVEREAGFVTGGFDAKNNHEGAK